MEKESARFALVTVPIVIIYTSVWYVIVSLNLRKSSDTSAFNDFTNTKNDIGNTQWERNDGFIAMIKYFFKTSGVLSVSCNRFFQKERNTV